MAECAKELKRTVPLYRVVAAAVVDSFEEIGKVQQVYSHWASRKLKELNRQVLKMGIRKVTLTVNRNTNTATLPPDFGEEIFVGVIVDGTKIPLKLRPELVDYKNLEDIPCEDKCEKCNQSKSVCEDLTITEETVLVNINDSIYEQTIIKKLYPDGRYFLETRIPVWDVESETVIYTTTKQFVTALDLKPCGCIDETPENIEKIKCCAYDVYCCHFSDCDNTCTDDYGGYRVFEDTGLIQFDAIGKFKQVYIEYTGFMPKKNGQYMVPEVAFETLVEWIKFRNIDGRRSSPNVDKKWRFDMFRVARGNMEKEIGRIGLSQIMQAINSTPKFDIDHYVCEPETGIIGTATYSAAAGISVNGSGSNGSSGSGGSGETSTDDCGTQKDCPPTSSKSFVPFDIAVIAGAGGNAPVAGVNTYQNDKLKNAIGVNMIIVNNSPETIKGLQFTLNTTDGILSRWQADGITPNNWFDGDVLIVPTFFKLI